MGVVVVLALLGAAVSAWSAVAPSGPDPAVKEWPAWPYATQCNDGLPFYAPAAFSGPTEAEKGTKPSEAALREVIEQGPNWPKSNWRLLAEDEDRAEFVNGRLSGEVGLRWLSAELHDGAWRSRQSGGCEPTSIVGNGPVVTWSLAEPEEPASNAAVRRIKVHLGPGECASGARQNPRARLAFRKWGRKLLMTIWLKPLPPLPPGVVHSCQGVDELPLEVNLPRKIKLSKLYDGSTYPPTPAIERNRR